MLLEQLDLEAGHEALRQLTNVPAAVRQMLPFVGIEERELRSHVGWSVGAAKIEMRDCRGPGIDVSWQQGGPLHERIDEAALARFHLPDDGNSAEP